MGEKDKMKMRVVKQKVDAGDAAEAQTSKPMVVGLARPRPDHGLRPVQEQIAESSVHYCNWQYEGAREDWPLHMAERHVARMYPYAKPSALLVDFADTEEEKFICEEKAKRIRKRGYRYLIVSNGMTVEQALEQLGEPGGVADRTN